jgi:hypothetical protein
VLTVVAGLAGVVLLAVNPRKQRVTQAEHGRAVQRAERERVQWFNERFGPAAEQLAHESWRNLPPPPEGLNAARPVKFHMPGSGNNPPRTPRWSSM